MNLVLALGCISACSDAAILLAEKESISNVNRLPAVLFKIPIWLQLFRNLGKQLLCIRVSTTYLSMIPTCAVQSSWFARVNALFCNLSHKKSREVAASLPSRFLSRRCFTLCITMEVQPRNAKQYKCQHCCSCKNYWGKGDGGWKKSVFASFFR